MYVFLSFFCFGIPEISCNLYNPGGDFTGYWGPFVKGPTKALVGWQVGLGNELGLPLDGTHRSFPYC